MVGLIAYTGEEAAAPILLRALRQMEYRGYDSFGIATLSKRKIFVSKRVGRIANDADAVSRMERLPGTTGLGHTRWATHGGVREENAHPHLSCMGEVAIVHNGIVENYSELKKQLSSRGHEFKSETDSEVLAHLLEEEYKNDSDPVKATLRVVRLLKGVFAVAAIFADRPDLLVGFRHDAGLIAGISEDKKFFASDVLAFLEYTDDAAFLKNSEVGVLTNQGLKIFDSEGKRIKREITSVAQKSGIMEITKNGEIAIALIHGNISNKYSLEIRIPKVAVQALEILPGQHLYWRLEYPDRIVFQKNEAGSHGKVAVTGRGGGAASFGIIVPSEARDQILINEQDLIQVKLSGKHYFVLEKVKIKDKELAGILAKVVRKE